LCIITPHGPGTGIGPLAAREAQHVQRLAKLHDLARRVERSARLASDVRAFGSATSAWNRALANSCGAS
jgi:hypothetical protein